MSYSTQNLGSLVDDLATPETTGRGKAAKGEKTAFWKSQGFVLTLAVIAVAVLLGGMWVTFFNNGGVKVPSSVTLLDIKTGEMFSTSTDRLALPAKNPGTGERTLFPIIKDDTGGWYIPAHYHEGVENAGYSPEVIPDLAAAKVVITDKSVEKLKR
ncbi:MAG: hypothetical protein H6814_11335 [Phycisphaeraceae bacterium]|nr:hypothetical protein [Phycisphaeraceae bacterium]